MSNILMPKKPIFIHIPKTGGTSINCVMQNTEWQTVPDFYYRHLIYETKMSNAGDIFSRDNVEKYSKYFIFMMLRDPVDRLISEYHFLQKHQEFMSMLQPVPRSFEDYIKNPQTSNYMLKFLDGRRIYDSSPLSKSRADEIFNMIEMLDVRVGIFEEFQRSLSYFAKEGGFQFPSELKVKRATLNRPEKTEISSEVVELIQANNQLDFMFYKKCKARLLSKSSAMEVQNYNFVGGRYDHVIPYTTGFCILDMALKDRQFIEVNKNFLITLNIYLHKTVETGEEYCKEWVRHFKKSSLKSLPNCEFIRLLKNVDSGSPLDDIVRISELIDLASRDLSLGLDVTHPQIMMSMSKDMVAVMRREGLSQPRRPIW